jgi:hypothetical protein
VLTVGKHRASIPASKLSRPYSNSGLRRRRPKQRECAGMAGMGVRYLGRAERRECHGVRRRRGDPRPAAEPGEGLFAYPRSRTPRGGGARRPEGTAPAVLGPGLVVPPAVVAEVVPELSRGPAPARGSRDSDGSGRRVPATAPGVPPADRSRRHRLSNRARAAARHLPHAGAGRCYRPAAAGARTT